MTREIIQVYGHDIKLQYSVGIHGKVEQDIMPDIISEIEEAIRYNNTEGTLEMFYTEDYDGSEVENDIDVKWSIVDWKEVAGKLAKAAVYSADMRDNDSARKVRQVLQEYNQLIQDSKQ